MEPAGSKHSNSLEYFKAGSTFISSVIIAIAGILVTSNYNSKQIELQRQRADSELQLTQLREISAIIPKLGSENDNDRRFAALALGLHGPSALPALNAILGDTSRQVRDASIQSIAVIGDTAMSTLIHTFRDGRTRDQRASALRALALLPTRDSAYTIAMEAIASPREDPVVRVEAAYVLGTIRNAKARPALQQALMRSRDSDTALASWVLWALSEMPDTATTADVAGLLNHPAPSVRYQAAWSLAQINPQEAARRLPALATGDTAEHVRSAATHALEWARRLSGQ